MQATEEQQNAVQKFLTGRPLKIAAFAGTGKTSTLVFMAKAKQASGLYLAFNKAIADEAKEKFPRSVECRTTHSLAYRAIKPLYGPNSKLSDTLHARQLASIAGYKNKSFGETLLLTDVQQAHLVLGTIKRFCQSADPAITEAHMPRYGRLVGLKMATLAIVRAWASSEAGRVWTRMIDPRDDLPMGHDGYLKLWALKQPKLLVDYVLLDEAQDTNQVVLGVLRAQSSQIVYVGDKHQQIYEWRGAINAMEQVKGCEEASLTQSFRFGEGIATVASRVIATLGEPLRLRGNQKVQSSIVGSGATTRTVLARTNASVIVEVLEATNARRTPYVVGGTGDLVRLLRDVYELKAGKPGSCPEFFGFTRWSDVVVFSESEEGESIKTFVQLVEQHGEGKLWGAVKSVGDNETGADVILSTAHKAKGREWDSVRLAGDFASSRLGTERVESEAEVRLFYVAMTRAKNILAVDPALLSLFASGAWNVPKTTQPVNVARLLARPPAARPPVMPAAKPVALKPVPTLPPTPVPKTIPPLKSPTPLVLTAPVRPKAPKQPSIWKRIFGG